MSHPLRSQVAVVGVGYSELSRNSDRSVGSHALQACRNAIVDAGLSKEDIDGVGAIFATDLPTVWPGYVIDGLGLPSVSWTTCTFPPSINVVIDGVQGVYSGMCRYALCYHAKYRWDTTSAAARNDPMRKAPWRGTVDGSLSSQMVAPYGGGHPFAAAMQRYMHLYGTERKHFGMVAVNNRTNAVRNPRAVFREPITMDDYLASRTIADPFCLYDMDTPIDGGMAVVLTLAERAHDHPHRPVLVEAIANGAAPQSDLMLHPDSFAEPFEHLVATLWDRSGLRAEDMDVVNLYDGFSILTLGWIDAVFAGRGGAGPFLQDSWREEEADLRFLGRIPMSPHGGNLSEGRLQGFGHVNEAVLQLRGEAGPTQIDGAQRALVTNGLNPICGGMVLRTPE